MRIRGAVFDLDTALLDFRRMKLLASGAAARAMVRAGASFPFDVDSAGGLLFHAYEANLNSNSVFTEFLHAKHQGTLDQHDTDRVIAAAVNAYEEAKRTHLDPFPGVGRMLVKLARNNVRTSIVTDAPRFKAYQQLDIAGLTDFFDHVLVGDDTAGLVADAVDAAGLRGEEVVAVGTWDGPTLARVHASGVRSAWARYARDGAEVPGVARHTLHKAGDLVQVVALSG